MTNAENEYIELAKHCIGLDYKNPYYRHGKAFYKPYRNYFDCGEKLNKQLEVMVNSGYAKDDGKSCCWLTRAGLDRLGKELCITIYDESR